MRFKLVTWLESPKQYAYIPEWGKLRPIIFLKDTMAAGNGLESNTPELLAEPVWSKSFGQVEWKALQ